MTLFEACLHTIRLVQTDNLSLSRREVTKAKWLVEERSFSTAPLGTEGLERTPLGHKSRFPGQADPASALLELNPRGWQVEAAAC